MSESEIETPETNSAIDIKIYLAKCEIATNRFYLYKITNTKNNKIYIGQTVNPKRRWWSYKRSAIVHEGDAPATRPIERAFIKYGADSFTFEIIAMSWSAESADAAETMLIEQYNSRDGDVGYNIAPGGNVFHSGPHSPETLKKMSKGLLKYYETHDSHQKGVPLTEEWKKNISIASMGKPGTNTGKQFSPEWRLKISKSQLGKTRENTKERRFTTEIELEICKLYVEKKKSTYWLGNKYNCNRSLILTILDRNNVERRQSNYTGHDNGRRIFSDEQEKEICDTYKTGTVTLSDMSEKFDCKVSTIKSILLRYDVKL